jgi:DNA-binding transcriptional regulator YiaG
MPETPLADQGKPLHSDRVDIIEPNAFELVEMQRIPKKTTEWLIEAALYGFGVSGGQLARLLGTSSTHVCSWRNGRIRLSSAFSGRLLELWILHNEGLPLGFARSIDWRTGAVEWNNGKVTLGNHRLSKAWEYESKPRRATSNLLNWNSDGPGPGEITTPPGTITSFNNSGSS